MDIFFYSHDKFDSASTEEALLIHSSEVYAETPINEELELFIQRHSTLNIAEITREYTSLKQTVYHFRRKRSI